MKDLLRKIKTREKIVTAACRVADGIEWSAYKVGADGRELVDRGSATMDVPADSEAPNLEEARLPEEVSNQLKGEVIVAMRSSDLLLRAMEFPTTDSAEIGEMLGFQIDKISPFPVDQLAMAHEVLLRNEESSQVLMAAAKRDRVDAIGDLFERSGARIHSIDARVMGWMQLINDEGHLAANGCELLVIADDIDFALIVARDGEPIAFRSLHARLDEPTVIDEIASEVSYTLTALDAEQELPAPNALRVWSTTSAPNALRTKLAEKIGVKVEFRDLFSLPPLSEGVIRRALDRESRIELIPREWVEHMKRQRLLRRFGLIAGGVVATWLVVLLAFFAVFKVRDNQLNTVQAEANAIAPQARIAAQNQQKLKTLRAYSDRSDSSLECLREVTAMLPTGDIEFVSYGYDKNKGVTLRGTGRDKNIVTDFFATLNQSDLFDGIRNESVNDKVIKGVKRAIFSVSLPLAQTEEDAR